MQEINKEESRGCGSNSGSEGATYTGKGRDSLPHLRGREPVSIEILKEGVRGHRGTP